MVKLSAGQKEMNTGRMATELVGPITVGRTQSNSASFI